MTRAWPVPALAACLALFGCPSREMYLRQADVPWETEAIAGVRIPAFDAEPAAWTLAERARLRVAEALGRGTVAVTDGVARASLDGAIIGYAEVVSPQAPRRVVKSGGGLTNAYAWEMDVSYTVQFGVAIRLMVDGHALWSRDNFASADETSTVAMAWPGSDPLPPPPAMPGPPDPRTFQRLRDQALDRALEPLLDALVSRFEYRTVW